MAEALGELPQKGELIMTSNHPFLRKVTEFMADREEWEGTATELLTEIGDSFTPPNTVTKLLNRYDCTHFYGRWNFYQIPPHQPKEDYPIL